MLRILGATEAQRDAIIDILTAKKVGTSVHYIPMATLTLFKNKGYDIKNYPNTYARYANEISLPIYNGLKNEQIDFVIASVAEAVAEVLG